MYFKNPQTVDELKQQYKELVKKFHPDLNRKQDTTAKMQQIVAEYTQLFENLSNKRRSQDGKIYNKNTDETAADFVEVINLIIGLPDIEIEIIGSWLWVTGNTKSVKEQLKAAGMRWSKSKSAWYWHKDPWHGGYSKSTLSDLRAKYGSQDIEKEERQKIS